MHLVPGLKLNQVINMGLTLDQGGVVYILVGPGLNIYIKAIFEYINWT